LNGLRLSPYHVCDRLLLVSKAGGDRDGQRQALQVMKDGKGNGKNKTGNANLKIS